MRRTILWHAVTGLVLSGLVTLSSGCRKEKYLGRQGMEQLDDV